MFYNTGIATYVWILSTDKPKERQGRVQLIDGSKLFHKMKKGLGSKRNRLTKADIDEIVTLYGDFEASERSKIFDTTDFFYRTITVERPLQRSYTVTDDNLDAALAVRQLAKLTDEARESVRRALLTLTSTHLSRTSFTVGLKKALTAEGESLPPAALVAIADAIGVEDTNAELARDAKGALIADPELRDTENVPWDEDIHEYLEREVRPFAPHAWIDESKTKEGCEIPFTRHFYVYTPPRSLEDIDRDLDEVLGRIRRRLEEVRG